MRREIRNDEEYKKTLDWLVSKAIELEDPLLQGGERAKIQMLYDEFYEAAERYRRRLLIAEYPGIVQHYDKLGFPYDLPEGFNNGARPERAEEAEDAGPRQNTSEEAGTPGTAAREATQASESTPAAAGDDEDLEGLDWL